MFVLKGKIWYNKFIINSLGGEAVSKNELKDLVDKLEEMKKINPEKYTKVKGCVEDLINKKESVIWHSLFYLLDLL